MSIQESLRRLSLFNDAFAELREFTAPMDSDRAHKVLIGLAEAGLPIATLAVAASFELGKGAPLDRELARQYYALAADQGIAVADFHLGRMYYDDKEYHLAVPCFLRAAEKADLRTLLFSLTNVYLGTCLEHGLGVSVDPVLAFSCYRNAAVVGDASGLYYCAKCYQTGFGVQKDLERMEMLLRDACKMNDARAWYMLGDLYLSGEIPGTREEAMDCMKRAAELKLPEALVFYGEHLATMAEYTVDDMKAAVICLNQAIDAQQYRACYVLAYLYAMGKATELNLERALELCNQAAVHRVEDAIFTLARFAETGSEALKHRRNWFFSRRRQLDQG